jgi:hypothetical protein
MKTLIAVGQHIDPADVSDSDALEGVTELNELAARLASVRLGLLGQVDVRKAARTKRGATSTAPWLRQHGTAAGAANREVTLAGALVEHTATRAALATGRITADQAGVITTALDRLSDQVNEVEKAQTEAVLLDKASYLDPSGLRKAAVWRAVQIDPQGSGDLARAEKAMVAQRELTIWADRDGRHHLRGVLDPEGAVHLLNALDPLAKPRPSTAEGQDMRTAARRRADALVDLAILATRTDEPGTSTGRPTVLVSIDWDTLQGHVQGAGRLLGGTLAEPISIERIRQIACDADILPAVMDSRSARLNLGRKARSASPEQRLALVARDGPGCAFPGCDRPYGWTDAHHIQHWADGGTTDLANLVLTCGTHHDLIHHHNWTVSIGDHGRPIFDQHTDPPDEPPPDPPDLPPHERSDPRRGWACQERH